MNTARFDATVDFETPHELEQELMGALAKLPIGDESVVGLHLPADGDECEWAELAVDEAEFTRETRSDDWVLVCSVNQVNPVTYFAAELRKLLNA